MLKTKQSASHLFPLQNCVGNVDINKLIVLFYVCREVCCLISLVADKKYDFRKENRIRIKKILNFL